MPKRYYIVSDNTFVALAIEAILNEAEVERNIQEKGVMRILVLSEKKRIQDIIIDKEYRIDKYDIIVCSELYYSLCRAYLGNVTKKIISMDKGLKSLRDSLLDFFEHYGNAISLNDITQLTSLTQDERITITNFLSQNKYKTALRNEVNETKAISRYKRGAMSKLGCKNNMELWLAMNFLYYLGYIPMFKHEKMNWELMQHEPVMLHDNACCF
ncbi:hypothetical protein ACMZZG_00680 [Pseudocitrobacter faecalis]|uniref:hypothetical protein n=1 Tax=Pseudocitrobacter faecalis TaxID=1398493 RepID=UPI0039EEC0B4